MSLIGFCKDGCEYGWTIRYPGNFFLMQVANPNSLDAFTRTRHVWSDNPEYPHQSKIDPFSQKRYIGILYICDLHHEQLIFDSLKNMEVV